MGSLGSFCDEDGTGRQNSDHGDGDGACAAKRACLVSSRRRGDHSCQVGEGEEDERLQSRGVLARPGRRLGALTACLARAGRVWARVFWTLACVSLLRAGTSVLRVVQRS